MSGPHKGPTLKVSLSDEQMDGLRRLAQQSGQSISQFVQDLITEATLRKGTDHGQTGIK